MTPPSMETVFLILSGVILFAGVVYWLWSHIQLTQKKVQLLENAVFELRAMIPGDGTAGPPPSVMLSAAPMSAPAPAPSVGVAAKPYTDLGDDDWEESTAVPEVPAVSTPLEAVLGDSVTATPVPTPVAPLPQMVIQETETGTIEDLMPGGRIAVVPEPVEEDREVPLTEDAFKAMLKSRATSASASAVAPSGPASVASVSTPALDGMPLKELRRLGEQRGIVGAADMRKKELLAALRQMVATAPAQAVAGNTLDLDAVEAQGVEEVVEPAASSDIEQEAQILE